MNATTCNCPACSSGRGEFELYESFESDTLSEGEELELAMELLSVSSEQELDQFLGSLMKTVGRGLKSAGKFVSTKVLPVVGPALKQIAKVALPIAGGALGSFIPIPGVGTMIGRTLGQAAANALEMETAGMEPEQADLEKARRFVRIAASAIADASTALRAMPFAPGSPRARQVAASAVSNAVRRYIPSVASAAVRQPGIVPAHGGAGTWRRHGNSLVIEGA
jgi:hypothetical protein